MNSEKHDNLISVHIDGEEVRVPPGTDMIEAARSIGTEIPHYCYHPKLSVVGNCRMCLVEMGMPGRDRETGEPMLDEKGQPKILWMPKPAVACATGAAPGMHIRTDSALVRSCREGVMEFLLVNHPLDCPICDQAGECHLQEFATDYGRGYSRFVEEKNVKPKRTRLGPRVMLDDERCILCSRCIRFCKEIADDDVLGFIDRGSYSTLTCFPGKELANNYSLNTVDICPVGALTSTDFRFRMRPWFLKQSPSICIESSVGVNTVVWSREGTIYRITPRRNDAVNDTWMSDSGRTLYKGVDSGDRMNVYTLEGRPADAGAVLEECVALLRGGSVAVVGSGRSSVEEQWMLKRTVEALGDEIPVYLVGRTEPGDGLLISNDRNPNVRGALLTGLMDTLPAATLDDLGARIEAGEIDTILSFGEDLCAAGLARGQLKKVRVIYAGTHHNDCSQRSRVEIPLLTVFERSGSFVNQQFRLQRFSRAIPGPEGVYSDLAFLALLHARLTGLRPMRPEPAEIWKHLSREIAALRGIEYDRISDTGVVIDGSKFAHLPFCEGKSLHYEPTAATAVS